MNKSGFISKAKSFLACAFLSVGSVAFHPGCFIDTPTEYPVMGSYVTETSLEGEWSSDVFFDDYGGTRYFRISRSFTSDPSGSGICMNAVHKISVYSDRDCSVPLYSVWIEYDVYLRDEYQAYLNYARQSVFLGKKKYVLINDAVTLVSYNAENKYGIPAVLNQACDITGNGSYVDTPGSFFDIPGFSRINILYPALNGLNSYQAFMIKNGFLYEGDMRLKKDGGGYPSELITDWHFTKKN
jgi:hypothetical protein